MFQTMQRLVKVEGWRGLYRGYTAGLLGTVHGGVQFYVLEELKKHYVVDKQSHLQMILFPAFSKCIGNFLLFFHSMTHCFFSMNLSLIASILFLSNF